MPQAQTTNNHQVAWGFVWLFIGGLFGLMAVVISPTTVWTAVPAGLLDGLLPVYIQEWMMIFSMPACFAFGLASFGLCSIGMDMIEDDPKIHNS